MNKWIRFDWDNCGLHEAERRLNALIADLSKTRNINVSEYSLKRSCSGKGFHASVLIDKNLSFAETIEIRLAWYDDVNRCRQDVKRFTGTGENVNYAFTHKIRFEKGKIAEILKAGKEFRPDLQAIK